MNPVILALEEYGIPLQLGLRLAPTLGNPETLDKGPGCSEQALLV